MAERGNRRKAAARTKRHREPERTLTGWRLWLRRTMIWGGALALLGALFLGLAVLLAVAALGIPGRASNRRAPDQVQRTFDGRVLYDRRE